MDSNPRFTVLPKSCLDAWVESVGLSKLSDDVGDSLAEDTTYRLREAVHVRHNSILYDRVSLS